MTVNVMHTATREGARLAVVTGPDTTQVKSRVIEILNAASITPKSVSISGPDADNHVTVSTVMDFTVIPGQILGTFQGTIELSASTSMRHESGF